MPSYRVVLREALIHTIRVQAADEDAAKDKALAGGGVLGDCSDGGEQVAFNVIYIEKLQGE